MHVPKPTPTESVLSINGNAVDRRRSQKRSCAVRKFAQFWGGRSGDPLSAVFEPDRDFATLSRFLFDCAQTKPLASSSRNTI